MASQLGRFRPIPELSGDRTILKNVCTCSSNLHSGSGIGRGSSLNCFKIVAADLGRANRRLAKPPSRRPRMNDDWARP